jgi:hypothetical protein
LEGFGGEGRGGEGRGGILNNNFLYILTKLSSIILLKS